VKKERGARPVPYKVYIYNADAHLAEQDVARVQTLRAAAGRAGVDLRGGRSCEAEYY
jgi:hypothetical protein